MLIAHNPIAYSWSIVLSSRKSLLYLINDITVEVGAIKIIGPDSAVIDISTNKEPINNAPIAVNIGQSNNTLK